MVPMRVPGPPNSPLSRRAALSRAVPLLNPTKKQPLRSVSAHAVRWITANPTVLNLSRSKTRTRTAVLVDVVPRRLHPRFNPLKRVVSANAAAMVNFPRKLLKTTGVPINAAPVSPQNPLLLRIG